MFYLILLSLHLATNIGFVYVCPNVGFILKNISVTLLKYIKKIYPLILKKNDTFHQKYVSLRQQLNNRPGGTIEHVQNLH